VAGVWSSNGPLPIIEWLVFVRLLTQSLLVCIHHSALPLASSSSSSGFGEPAAARQLAPFAVAEAPSDVYPSDFHLVTKMKQQVTGKVSRPALDIATCT
jgi:hypothetical protein